MLNREQIVTLGISCRHLRNVKQEMRDCICEALLQCEGLMDRVLELERLNTEQEHRMEAMREALGDADNILMDPRLDDRTCRLRLIWERSSHAKGPARMDINEWAMNRLEGGQ